MIEQGVIRYTCDACGKELCLISKDGNPKPLPTNPAWTIKSEVGDLCPSCSNAWENYKKSFIERMRKENGKSIITR